MHIELDIANRLTDCHSQSLLLLQGWLWCLALHMKGQLPIKSTFLCPFAYYLDQNVLFVKSHMKYRHTFGWSQWWSFFTGTTLPVEVTRINCSFVSPQQPKAQQKKITKDNIENKTAETQDTFTYGSSHFRAYCRERRKSYSNLDKNKTVCPLWHQDARRDRCEIPQGTVQH